MAQMFLIESLLKAVRSWRRRRARPRVPKRADVTMEQLDHRQLLTINFTGNVVADFIATPEVPAQIIQGGSDVIHPLIPPTLESLVKVSGFDIQAVGVAYDPSTDTLSIGLQGPPNQKTGQDVIAGDADNNLDSATVDPAVLAVEPGFQDFADLGGSETMGAFLDLNGDGEPDIVAGVSNEIGGSKFYQVAEALVNPAFPRTPSFGTPLPANTGNVYLVNDPAHPNFEFNIDHFSSLYQQVTGQQLTPDSTFGVGAFGNSNDDDGISEAFFPSHEVSNLIPPPPPPPPTCPPLEPRIMINPHQHRHINTAHPTLVRVNILGSAGFDVTQINESTVQLGGASPIASFTRHIDRDQYLDATYVFLGNTINLPPGVTDAQVTGQLNDGTKFASTYQVFNRSPAFYSPAQLAQAQARQLHREASQALHDQALGLLQAGDPSTVTVPLAGTATPTITVPLTRSAAASPVVQPFGSQPVHVLRQRSAPTVAPQQPSPIAYVDLGSAASTSGNGSAR